MKNNRESALQEAWPAPGRCGREHGVFDQGAGFSISSGGDLWAGVCIGIGYV